ncbi:cytochrome b/b6 domain-containing protein [Salinibacterium sp. ZJ70]|uniref:cytochrome b/b6 domain-containing protein n=1 Tax=Salinibacterium sp. ZJ70 TaxID=2708084 RepID=UPI001422A770|nr:cytochrome b/b6 domain-containing protein [Salinibacterium sp. ZJ70]
MTTTADATRIRRGLPRSPGGAQWPIVETPDDELLAVAETAAPEGIVHEATDAAPSAHPTGTAEVDSGHSQPDEPLVVAARGETLLRRGLPRVLGGSPWPPAGAARDRWARALAEAEGPSAVIAETIQADHAAHPSDEERGQSPVELTAQTRAASREPRRIGGIPLSRAVAIVAVALVLAVAAVLGAQWFRGQQFGMDFIETYPGATPLPDGAPEGLPAWLNWQHFLNAFLMVLIIKTGIQVRRETRPSAYWSPRWKPTRKISISIWLHQAVDLLWLVNGVIFVILLAATGQWVRVVPLDVGVLPNAVSAGIQYLSLDWPADENGWVHYNALQMLTYFTTIFIAAPLAALTGVRMSGIWPSGSERLNRLYPLEWARAVHFPVMLYFVAFIFVHVALVLSTGTLRNLNHMYAGQDATHWWGLVIFLVSVSVMALGAIVARPVVVAPIAKLFGSVTSR